ncbi:PP2C family protein-serine/threonine phosphatase [Streptomyces sp. TLI_171]|uniref:PP2C family protein-serine/threonine phosphatase n=1 Tax=Streptomyces sp. TLI_171 TaxID=1938859 RepID=UPI000C1A1A3F|nr:PP2C family protein-serine/threonine phosphatase [Streptomyces sp. TLI_171]RKE17101.1 stage II sporulation protein E [Streptomyces sp. TLI_171]
MVLLPIGLIVLICAVDISISPNIHLGPLLVVAPAITPSFAGTRMTALIGALAVAAQIVIAVLHGGLFTANHQAQVAALALITCALVAYCRVRERHGRELDQVRTVSDAVQRVLMRPLPENAGPLRIASRYLAADDEANVGGDLYAVVRTDRATRLLVGDVRGKGLGAVGDAAALLGAFRELAHRHHDPGELADALEASYRRHLAELADTGQDVQENFVTALVLDVPDQHPVVRIADCGHPPPLLLAGDRAGLLALGRTAPPLGMSALGPVERRTEEFAFPAGSTLLLYTDGVTEARDGDGTFYPLPERAARFPLGLAPADLLDGLRRDLLDHVGGRLMDDAALIAVARER